jgi:3-oxoacyl-[acyl-carrier protein] reductase
VLAERGMSNSAAFAASQAAARGMTQSLALEWARTGIRVNAIGLGWYEATSRPIEEQQKERLVRYLPLRRKGQPSDIAALLVYLASDASAFVTGQTVYVDGGALAHA